MAKRPSIAILALCQVMAMALWFSASAVVPQLVAEYRLSGFMQSALTSGVQLGFVAGCLVSAFLGLADRLELRRFFAGSSDSVAPSWPSPPPPSGASLSLAIPGVG